MNTYVYYTEDYLAHHGVKGQHWGVRRYQNKDGSLTVEGYQHYGLNPDGSKFRGRKERGYTDATVSSFRKGAAVGAVAGAALGYTAGPVGAYTGATVGAFVGSVGGTVVGTINTRKMQHKIKKQLAKNGKVYVKDL